MGGERRKMATSSGQVELDAVFIKALKLLHSRHPDSLDQLRALRDEVVRQHSQQVPPPKISKVSSENYLRLKMTYYPDFCQTTGAPSSQRDFAMHNYYVVREFNGEKS